MINHHVSLRSKNTLGLTTTAEGYSKVNDLAELQQVLSNCRVAKLKPLPLGEGSNVVLQPQLPYCVLDIAISGIKKLRENDSTVWVEVGAGENWHQWVMQSIAENWFGIENLALIPGRVGAAPIQNIGAYGCEVNSVIDCVNYIEINSDHSAGLQLQSLDNPSCDFNYRDSIFKHALANKTVITSVVFKLQKQFIPKLEYPALKQQIVNTDGVAVDNKITAEAVAEAVISIRNAKLPNPKHLPNAGSFFKNIEVKQSQLDQFLELHPNAPYFAVPSSQSLNNSKETEASKHYRIPSAWLIDQCGLKGHRIGNIGLHKQQALVLVNYSSTDQAEGAAAVTAAEVISFADYVADIVKTEFGFSLQIEPQLIPAASKQG